MKHLTHEIIANTLDVLSFEIFAQAQQKGGDGGQWSKASAAWMRRQSLQGCIYGVFTERPPFPTE